MSSKKKVIFILKNYQLYLMMLPGFILLILFKYVPMYGLVIAFKDFNPRKGILRSDWIGFKNFVDFFNLPDFWPLMKNTLLLSVEGVIIGFFAPIILALLINEIKYKNLQKKIQISLYAPNFISTVVVVGMMFLLLSPVGPVNKFLISHHITRVPFMTSDFLFRSVYITSSVWQATGWGTIIYTAALAGVSPELVEAAKLDGASILQKIRYIDLPTLKPLIVVLLILSVGGIMSIGYEKAFLMQTPLNLGTSEIIPTFLYKIGLQQGDYSFSTAVGLFNAAINLVLLIAVNFIVKRLNDGEGI